jgi:2-iminobutanoate/2-iminopropanoate deaminase
VDSARLSILSEGAPAAIGPYSHAIRYGEVLYCSGQLPLEPERGVLVEGSIAAETKQCLENLAAVCADAGTDLSKALRIGVFTTRLDLFDEINSAYSEFFAADPPARTAIGVAALPRGVSIEIDAMIGLPD